MSATRTNDPGDLGGPVPRRVRPPRWLDLRLVLGVLLVLGSVLVGARVVTAADATVPVWAAAGDLAAGTVLSVDDLVAVSVRLDDAAGAYLSTSTRPEGRPLARAVRSGELVPRSALEGASTEVQLALPVQAGFAPPGLTRGQVVDVYAVADAATGATGAADGGVTLVLAGATVQSVSGRGDGVLSSATTTIQVVVSLPAERAGEVLAAVGGRGLVVVVRTSVETPAGGGLAAPAGSVPPPAVPTPAVPGAAVPDAAVPTAAVPTDAVPPDAGPSPTVPAGVPAPATTTG
ncbi:flagellar biosynthesis protein FlgA [Modestobacter sp. I12A-02628]|uniref:Flagellar biosynthesis protein FlgA n=1 Tax=Goekera deserti TaxID=2497753 RepID=A0A7K3W9P0_9ACTN|nr:SAF domain-containing protein [Goekera deserti]MPQ99816.1 flagellar biosynthesis protein FlgA [Goekera deserti]NDI49973.1 flagellar biosynthesis protein FlgA [Goekera deserti]NEL52550.1 flagellar biosynthesis protein FlgA [Goekera deserti]